MLGIIYNSLILILVIVIGYGAKKVGIVSSERDFPTISKLILYITLPSAIITNLNGLRFPPALLVISLFGLFCNWVYIMVGKTVGEDKEEKSFMVINVNGYNIGNFAFPFIAFFLEGLPILAISLFDAGNAVMTMGFNYATAKSIKSDTGKMDFLDLFRTVIKSPTVIVYAIMVSLSLLSINLPNMVLEVASIAAGANTFLAMFLIGVALELNINRKYLKKLLKFAFFRYATAFVLAALVFLIPFFPIEIKHTLVLILFAPTPGAATIFTGLIDGDVRLAAQFNSLSIIISIILMSSYLVLIGA